MSSNGLFCKDLLSFCPTVLFTLLLHSLQTSSTYACTMVLSSSVHVTFHKNRSVPSLHTLFFSCMKLCSLFPLLLHCSFATLLVRWSYRILYVLSLPQNPPVGSLLPWVDVYHHTATSVLCWAWCLLVGSDVVKDLTLNINSTYSAFT